MRKLVLVVALCACSVAQAQSFDEQKAAVYDPSLNGNTIPKIESLTIKGNCGEPFTITAVKQDGYYIALDINGRGGEASWDGRALVIRGDTSGFPRGCRV